VPDPSLYPRFSAAELERRRAAVRSAMAEQDLACLVLYGRGRDLDVQYLSEWPGTRESYLVFPRASDATLFVQLSNHLPNAQRLAALSDVRWGGVDSAASVAAALRERDLGRARIGVVGAVPWQHQHALARALPEAQWTDASAILRDLRLVKSAEEIERVRIAARINDAAMAALEREVRPGLREDQLGGIVEAAIGREGGAPGIHYMATTPMRAPQIGVPAQIPSRRVIERGDVLITEISAEHWGYSGQIHRAYAIGQPPTAEYARIHEVALACYERIVAVLRDGATAEQVVDAADVVHERGYTLYDDLFHGTNQLPPILRSRPTLHRPVPDLTFRAGMVVVVQPNVVTPDARFGLQVGETLLVTREGTERLHAYPMRFVECGVA
jgi:Xaa-Pro aminopeptidase